MYIASMGLMNASFWQIINYVKQITEQKFPDEYHWLSRNCQEWTIRDHMSGPYEFIASNHSLSEFKFPARDLFPVLALISFTILLGLIGSLILVSYFIFYLISWLPFSCQHGSSSQIYPNITEDHTSAVLQSVVPAWLSGAALVIARIFSAFLNNFTTQRNRLQQEILYQLTEQKK